MKGVEEMNWWTEETWEVGSEVNALASGPVGNWLEMFGSHFGGDTSRTW